MFLFIQYSRSIHRCLILLSILSVILGVFGINILGREMKATHKCQDEFLSEMSMCLMNVGANIGVKFWDIVRDGAAMYIHEHVFVYEQKPVGFGNV